LQRIYKHGNSTAVSVPRQFMYALNWIAGQNIMVELLEDGAGILIRLPRQEDFGNVIPPRMVFTRAAEAK
jgi:antitoxin component of MazEF toxin-antitoxin module